MRDGDEWVLNGSKVWTTGAWWSDWALCLARTNWDVPKHRGLTVFMLPIRPAGHRGAPHRDAQRQQGVLPGVPDRRPRARQRPDRRRRRRLDGRHPVDVPRADALQLAARHHPRRARSAAAAARRRSSRVAHDAGRLDDPIVPRSHRRGPHARPGRRAALQARGSARASPAGTMSDQAVGRRPAVRTAVATARRTTIAFEIAGAAARRGPTTTASWPDSGNDFLMRQVCCIGGGTTEMARNVVSERVLGMPRERTRRPRRARSATCPRSPSARWADLLEDSVGGELLAFGRGQAEDVAEDVVVVLAERGALRSYPPAPLTAGSRCARSALAQERVRRSRTK